jgi:transcriptional regulator with XRE-family HTH domain
MGIAEALRQAILDSGKSAAQLSRETGVAQLSIANFLRGDDLRISAAEKLARYLGLSLTKTGPSGLSVEPVTDEELAVERQPGLRIHRPPIDDDLQEPRKEK